VGKLAKVTVSESQAYLGSGARYDRPEVLTGVEIIIVIRSEIIFSRSVPTLLADGVWNEKWVLMPAVHTHRIVFFGESFVARACSRSASREGGGPRLRVDAYSEAQALPY